MEGALSILREHWLIAAIGVYAVCVLVIWADNKRRE